MYPSLNNDYSWLNCEEDICNAHCGQGFDYHYHGDPFGPSCMYSASDYSSTTAHPYARQLLFCLLFLFICAYIC